MSVLVVGSTKGGSGKSTLAFNIAVFRANTGRKVLLIDADAQETATLLTEKRVSQFGETGYTIVTLKPGTIRSETPKLAQDYDDVIIDVGGRDNGPLRVALTVAHMLLIPIQPRSIDIWALDQMVEIIRETREKKYDDYHFKAFVVVNMADSVGRDNEDTLGVVQEIPDVEALPTMIGRRKTFANGTGTGKAVSEFLPRDTKAIEELAALVETIYSKGL